MYFATAICKRKSELLELRAIQQKQDIENTYFELLEHQNEELQIFVHDMQKHLGNIYNLSEDSEKTKNIYQTYQLIYQTAIK